MSDSFCIVPVIAPASPVTALLAMKKSPTGTVRFSMTRAASQSVQSRVEMRLGRKRKKRLFFKAQNFAAQQLLMLLPAFAQLRENDV